MAPNNSSGSFRFLMGLGPSKLSPSSPKNKLSPFSIFLQVRTLFLSSMYKVYLSRFRVHCSSASTSQKLSSVSLRASHSSKYFGRRLTLEAERHAMLYSDVLTQFIELSLVLAPLFVTIRLGTPNCTIGTFGIFLLR